MKLLIISILLFSTLYAIGQTHKEFEYFFNTDESKISAQEFSELNKFVKENEVVKIEIVGSTDDVGSNQYNQLLSEKRADFAEKYLVNRLGISEDIILKMAIGEIPLTGYNSNLTEERSGNRKVKLTILYRNKIPESKLEKKPQSIISSPEEPKRKELKLDELEQGDKIRLSAIQFEGGMDVFLASSYPTLDSLYFQLKKFENLKIEIQGHVCCLANGGEGVNLKTGKRSLSKDRAKAVFDYLVKKGIDEDRLSYVGLKAKFMTGTNVLTDRRVEILIK